MNTKDIDYCRRCGTVYNRKIVCSKKSLLIPNKFVGECRVCSSDVEYSPKP